MAARSRFSLSQSMLRFYIFSACIWAICTSPIGHDHVMQSFAEEDSVENSLEATGDSGVPKQAERSACLHSDDGLRCEARRSDDLLQEETGWIGLAQASNDAPGTEPNWRNAGCRDASNCSTAASEKSGKRKRKSDSSEEAAFLKPYECRFCPMKFAKSQALGGHMNRHRQEREHEQLFHARQLVMQQGLPSFMMPGQNSCSTLMPKLHQAQVQRSTDAPFKYSTRMAAPGAPVYTSAAQSDTYMPSTIPHALSWNPSTLSGSSANPAANLNRKSSSLDDGMPLLETRPPLGTPLTSVGPSYMQMQQSTRASGHDMLGMHYERNLQGSAFPLDYSALPMNPYAGQRSTLFSHSPHIQSEDSVSAGVLERHVNASPPTVSSGRSLHFQTSDIKDHSQVTSLEPEGSQLFNMTPTSGFQFMPQNSSPFFSSPAEGIRVPISNASTDFSPASRNQLEGLHWISSVSPLSNEEYPQTHDSEINIHQTDLAAITQSRLASGNLAMPNEANAPSGRIRDHPGVTGADSSLHFGLNHTHGTSEVDGKVYLKNSKPIGSHWQQ